MQTGPQHRQPPPVPVRDPNKSASEDSWVSREAITHVNTMSLNDTGDHSVSSWASLVTATEDEEISACQDATLIVSTFLRDVESCIHAELSSTPGMFKYTKECAIWSNSFVQSRIYGKQLFPSADDVTVTWIERMSRREFKSLKALNAAALMVHYCSIPATTVQKTVEVKRSLSPYLRASQTTIHNSTDLSIKGLNLSSKMLRQSENGQGKNQVVEMESMEESYVKIDDFPLSTIWRSSCAMDEMIYMNVDLGKWTNMSPVVLELSKEIFPRPRKGGEVVLCRGHTQSICQYFKVDSNEEQVIILIHEIEPKSQMKNLHYLLNHTGTTSQHFESLDNLKLVLENSPFEVHEVNMNTPFTYTLLCKGKGESTIWEDLYNGQVEEILAIDSSEQSMSNEYGDIDVECSRMEMMFDECWADILEQLQPLFRQSVTMARQIGSSSPKENLIEIENLDVCDSPSDDNEMSMVAESLVEAMKIRSIGLRPRSAKLKLSDYSDESENISRPVTAGDSLRIPMTNNNPWMQPMLQERLMKRDIPKRVMPLHNQFNESIMGTSLNPNNQQNILFQKSSNSQHSTQFPNWSEANNILSRPATAAALSARRMARMAAPSHPDFAITGSGDPLKNRLGSAITNSGSMVSSRQIQSRPMTAAIRSRPSATSSFPSKTTQVEPIDTQSMPKRAVSAHGSRSAVVLAPIHAIADSHYSVSRLKSPSVLAPIQGTAMRVSQMVHRFPAAESSASSSSNARRKNVTFLVKSKITNPDEIGQFMQ